MPQINTETINAKDLLQMCREEEPVFIEENLVVMTRAHYDMLNAKPKILEKLLIGQKQIADGNVRSFEEVFGGLEKKYGI